MSQRTTAPKGSYRMRITRIRVSVYGRIKIGVYGGKAVSEFSPHIPIPSFGASLACRNGIPCSNILGLTTTETRDTKYRNISSYKWIKDSSHIPMHSQAHTSSMKTFGYTQMLMLAQKPFIGVKVRTFLLKKKASLWSSVTWKQQTSVCAVFPYTGLPYPYEHPVDQIYGRIYTAVPVKGVEYTDVCVYDTIGALPLLRGNSMRNPIGIFSIRRRLHFNWFRVRLRVTRDLWLLQKWGGCISGRRGKR